MRRRALLVPGIVLAVLLVAAGGSLAAVSLLGESDDEVTSADEQRVLPERERLFDRLLPELEPFIDRLLPEREFGLPRPRQQPFVGVVLSEQGGDVVVEGVVPGGPAARAGIHEGDVIEAVSDTPVQDPAEVAEIVRGSERGDLLTFRVQRDGEVRDIEVRVGLRPGPLDLRERKPRSLLPDELLEFFALPNLRERLGELFERFVGASITFLDGGGERVTLLVAAGTIAEVSDDAVVVAPNDGLRPEGFTVTDDTRIVRGLRPAGLHDLEPGDRVLLVVRDESREALAILALPAIEEESEG